MEKKDSIFSSLGPAPSAFPASSSRQAAPDQDVQALRQKIESLERALAAQERKLAETRGAPPPPPPPKPPDLNAQFLLAKIGELDKKFEEFARNAVLSSLQMKNVEESKISARREIEDLLKVVREQQKYSEMDRQMHDQLEKSWRRVEELEKKLMDFYSSVVNAPSGPQAQKEIAGMVEERLRKFLEDMDLRLRNAADRLDAQAPALTVKGEEKIAAAVEGLVNAKLGDFLSDMDLRFKAMAAKLDAQTPAEVLKSEDKIARMVSDLDVRLTAFEVDFKKLHLYISSSEESINSLYLNMRRDLLAVMKDAVKEAGAAITERASAISARMEELFRKGAAETGERIRMETEKHTDKMIELSRLAAYSLSGSAALANDLGGLSARLVRLREEVQAFTDSFDTVKLEALMGVSGGVARKNYEGLRSSLKEMEKELAFFDSRKDRITAKIDMLMGELGSNGNEARGGI